MYVFHESYNGSMSLGGLGVVLGWWGGGWGVTLVWWGWWVVRCGCWFGSFYVAVYSRRGAPPPLFEGASFFLVLFILALARLAFCLKIIIMEVCRFS